MSQVISLLFQNGTVNHSVIYFNDLDPLGESYNNSSDQNSLQTNVVKNQSGDKLLQNVLSLVL